MFFQSTRYSKVWRDILKYKEKDFGFNNILKCQYSQLNIFGPTHQESSAQPHKRSTAQFAFCVSSSPNFLGPGIGTQKFQFGFIRQVPIVLCPHSTGPKILDEVMTFEKKGASSAIARMFLKKYKFALQFTFHSDCHNQESTFSIHIYFIQRK